MNVAAPPTQVAAHAAIVTLTRIVL